MKNRRTSRIAQVWGSLLVPAILLMVTTSFANPTGRTGATKLNSTAGCGGCHGSAADPAVTVTITGPCISPTRDLSFAVLSLDIGLAST